MMISTMARRGFEANPIYFQSEFEAPEEAPGADGSQGAAPSPEPAAPPAPKSWASLFHKPAAATPVDASVHSLNAGSPLDGNRTPISGSAPGVSNR